jgi:hypothetical protein
VAVFAAATADRRQVRQLRRLAQRLASDKQLDCFFGEREDTLQLTVHLSADRVIRSGLGWFGQPKTGPPMGTTTPRRLPRGRVIKGELSGGLKAVADEPGDPEERTTSALERCADALERVATVLEAQREDELQRRLNEPSLAGPRVRRGED